MRMLSRNPLNWCLPLFAVMALTATACGPSEEELAVQARAEEWGIIQQEKAALDEKRAEVDALEERLAVSDEELEVAEGETVEDVRAGIEAQITSLSTEIENQAKEFQGRLVDFINDGIDMEVEDEMQQQAFDINASEQLIIADEYGELGGDWARAIAIAEDLERTNPDNTEVQERLAFYREMRYMTEERFAGAEVGMTAEEIADVLGVPSRGNDRDFGNGRRGFFYLKDEDRSAAAVYFEQKGEDWVAYRVDYNAIDGSSGEGG